MIVELVSLLIAKLGLKQEVDGTLNTTIAGVSTEAKQDLILTALGGPVTAPDGGLMGTYGTMLLGSNPTSAGTLTHDLTALPGIDTVMQVWDTQGGTALPLTERLLATPHIVHSGAADVAWDWTRFVIGFDELPAAPYAMLDYLHKGDQVCASMRLTRAAASQLATPPIIQLAHRYYAFGVGALSTIAPGGVITLGMRAYVAS